MLADRGGFEGAARGGFAEDGDDFVAGNQFADGGDGFAGLGLVVLDDREERPAEDAAGGVYVIDGEARGFFGGLAPDGFFASERRVDADLDRLRLGLRGGNSRKRGGRECGGEQKPCAFK